MSHFISPWMLAGLLGIGLPMLVHLISRRKFDVVDWGAMQFLELGRKTRRKVRLEEFLLMLLRMGLIGLIAFAFSRPWLPGGIFSGLVSTQSRDIVLVIDGSYSMGREDGATTPHAIAIQKAKEFLNVLKPGDTVALIDARDQLRPVISPPTRDLELVRDELDNLPEPSGTANPASACTNAVQQLGRTSNLAREAIIFTDGQALGWSPYDTNLWARFETLKKQPSVQPNVWIIDVTKEQDTVDESNFFLDRLELSRELTVTDFPIRISSTVGRTGGTAAVACNVYLEIDGQRLKDRTQSHTIQPDGKVTVEFEYRFSSPGSHLISVSLDEDLIPGDNQADAAISVAEALPVLLVDGDLQADPVKRETFFARAALSATQNKTPWINAQVIATDDLTAERLAASAAVVLANVQTVSAEQADALRDFVGAGGGLLIAPGNQVDPVSYNETLFLNGNDLLPASLQVIRSDDQDKTAIDYDGITFKDSSLELPWIEQFRERNDGGFTQARFSNWWLVFPALETTPENRPAIDPNNPMPRPQDSAAMIAARLSNGDPALLTRRYGRGNTMLLTVPLDADWGTLPARPDYVPFLHEMLFVLSAGQSQHNVDVGTPLLHSVDAEFAFRQHHFIGPNETQFDVERAGDQLRPIAKLSDTKLPGIYRLASDNEPSVKDQTWFVVNFNRDESDLSQLTDEDITSLENSERLAFVDGVDDMKQRMLGDESRTELWSLLMLAFLGMLIMELVMTRRLVKGGHAETDIDPRELDQQADDQLQATREPSLV